LDAPGAPSLRRKGRATASSGELRRRGCGAGLARRLLLMKIVNRLRPSKEKSMTARRTLYEIVLGAALIGAMALAAAPIFS